MSGKKASAKAKKLAQGEAPAVEPRKPFAVEDLDTIYLRVKDITGKTITASFAELLNTHEGQQEIARYYSRRMLKAAGFVNGLPLSPQMAATMMRIIEVVIGPLVRGQKAALPTAAAEVEAKKK